MATDVDGIEAGLRVLAEYVTLPYEPDGALMKSVSHEDRRVLLEVRMREPRNREMMLRILEAGAREDPLGDFVTSLCQMAGRQIHPPTLWRIEVEPFPLTGACVRLRATGSGSFHGMLDELFEFPMENVLRWNRAEALLAIANGVGEVRSRL